MPTEAGPLSRKTLLLATRNAGKAREFGWLLAPVLDSLSLSLLYLPDLPGPAPPEPGENAQSFAGNAAIKAIHYRDLTGLPTLADDSGLLVDALNGAPGVLSARYGGPNLTDPGRCQRLLSALGALTLPPAARTARFEAALALALPGQAEPLLWEGSLHGSIALAPSGDGGFGYDPIFVPEGFAGTMAQLPPDEKNRLSHRARAVALMARDLGEIGRRLRA